MASQVKFPKKEPEPVPQEVPVFDMPEPPSQKLLRKFKQEPLVPLGALLTTGTIVVASYHLRKGNQQSFNRALRWRIYFQGATVVAAVGGIYYYGGTTPAPNPGAAAPLPDSSASSAAAYNAITTTPGRPPTIMQVQKEEARQEKSKREWEDRFKAAEAKANLDNQQARLEAALLRGTGVSQEEINAIKVAERQREKEEEQRWIEKAAMAAPKRPIIGQDGRDRTAGRLV